MPQQPGGHHAPAQELGACPGPESEVVAAGHAHSLLDRDLGDGAWVPVGQLGMRGDTRPTPELRIIDEDLWQAAHARLRASRAVYLEQTGGRACGRPTNPTESPYLLTGLLKCAHCGGGLHVSHKSWRKRSGVLSYYVCARQRTRATPAPGRSRCGWTGSTPPSSRSSSAG